MANEIQLFIILLGANAWNEFRRTHPDEQIDLEGADLSMVNLEGADLSMANLNEANLSMAYLEGADLRRACLYRANLSGTYLYRANLREACLYRANLREADLEEANLREADLEEANLMRADIFKAVLFGANLGGADLLTADFFEADLRGAHLERANLRGADLWGANLEGADLREADLTGATLVETNLERSILTGCNIYGISAWKLKLKYAEQNDLVITSSNEPVITVDDLEVAQFIYLLLHNEKVRQVIDTITSKVVLILGRFTPGRKTVLDAIREELRMRNYLPIMFDFETPANRDLRETISTLAHIARFVIADITDAKSIPAELEHIVPSLPSVPIMPLVLQSDKGYALFDSLKVYPWVIEPYQYEDQPELIASIVERIIAPAEKMLEEQRNK